MLSFIHLSDIHFQKYSGDAYDLDDDLRNELLIDLSKNFPKNISNANGILICGDIAFSAQEREYAVASDFLEQVCQRVSLDPSMVFCVPGNHDVDQAITRGSREDFSSDMSKSFRCSDPRCFYQTLQYFCH